MKQGDRADLLSRVRDGAGQPHPQLGLASGDRQSHPLALDGERAVVAADRDQGTLAPREPGVLLLVAALGGLEPSVAVATQHRPRPHHRQLSERSRAGELAAQRLIVADRGLALTVALPVDVQQPCPHVPGRPQQPVATVGLLAGDAQTDHGGPVHQTGSSDVSGHLERMFYRAGYSVKDRARHCGQPTVRQRHRSGPASRHLR
jgi:hypothetical protein